MLPSYIEVQLDRRIVCTGEASTEVMKYLMDTHEVKCPSLSRSLELGMSWCGLSWNHTPALPMNEVSFMEII